MKPEAEFPLMKAKQSASFHSSLYTTVRICLPLAYAGDKKVKRFHFSEIIGRLPYRRATVTTTNQSSNKRLSKYIAQLSSLRQRQASFEDSSRTKFPVGSVSYQKYKGIRAL
jgi:hypothetical protein